MKRIRLSPVLDLAGHLTDATLINLCPGPDGDLYALMHRGPVDYYTEGRGGARFAKVQSGQPHGYRVLRIGDGDVQLVEISDERWNFHHVQPLPNGELMLVCGRSVYRGRDDFDRNARLYDGDGRFVRDFCLGDGIEDVQATAEGRIWTSYFDEGVFGKRGWPEPIGASGLICWDNAGAKVYEFRSRRGLDTIVDCYALNVASRSSVWAYYYTQFPLVHLNEQGVLDAWSCPIRYSRALAVHADRVLMRGYDEPDVYTMFTRKKGGVLSEVMRYAFRGCGRQADWRWSRKSARSVHLARDEWLHLSARHTAMLSRLPNVIRPAGVHDTPCGRPASGPKGPSGPTNVARGAASEARKPLVDGLFDFDRPEVGRIAWRKVSCTRPAGADSASPVGSTAWRAKPRPHRRCWSIGPGPNRRCARKSSAPP